MSKQPTSRSRMEEDNEDVKGRRPRRMPSLPYRLNGQVRAVRARFAIRRRTRTFFPLPSSILQVTTSKKNRLGSEDAREESRKVPFENGKNPALPVENLK